MANLAIAAILEWSADGYTETGLKLGDVSDADGYQVLASFTSAPIFVANVDNYILHITCPGDGVPNATVSVQGSIDTSRSLNNKPSPYLQHWATIPYVNQLTGNIVTTQTISGASDIVFEETKNSWGWIRLVWANSSGSALLTAKFEGKGVTPR